MAYLICTPSGTGVNGSTIPRTGTVKFTFDVDGWTSNTSFRASLALTPIDSNGVEVSYASVPQESGGNWSNTDNVVIDIDIDYPQYTKNTVTVNIDTFLAYYSNYPTTAGLKLTAMLAIDYSYVGNEEYDFYFPIITNCKAPSNPKLSVSKTVNSATLSWGAGGNGTNNYVTGYVITYQDSSNGSSWGEVNYLKEVSGTSTTVDAPSTVGYYRRFGVQTKGSAGEDYLSEVVWSSTLQKISYNTVRYYTGSEWADCIVYYCTGTEWIECIPYYCDGTSWIECSST